MTTGDGGASPPSKPAAKPKPEKLSQLAKAGGELKGLTEKGQLQRDSLIPVVHSFAICNLMVLLLILILAVFDHCWPDGKIIINDKVIISVVGGLTVQVAAVIIAAFKGLFK